MLFAQTPIESETLRSALFGLLPDNWRMWAAAIGAVLFVFLNPQASWAIGSKVAGFVSTIIAKIRGIQVAGSSAVASGIDSPLQAAQTQIKWAVENKNSAVLDSAIATLEALMSESAKVAIVLFALSLVGCSAEPKCEYSQYHSFGYTPLTSTDREHVYEAEPTLSQQAAELFERDNAR